MGWVTVRARSDQTLHVIPLVDLVDHELDDCVRGPTAVPVERDDGSIAFYYTHHSLDGREANE